MMGLFKVEAFVCVLGLLISCMDATDYCRDDLCRSSTHIACNHDGSLGDQCASDAALISMGDAEKQIILDKHNFYRNKVAEGAFDVFEPAVRMATLVWDDELAQLAELNVMQCTMSHDACRNTDAFKSAGQNLAFSGTTGPAPPTAAVIKQHLNMWWEEYVDCTMDHINSYKCPDSGAIIGHFTQMVQDKATHIGCAMLSQNKDGYLRFYTACNYARTNLLNRHVYVSGSSPASGCQSGTNPDYPFLCSTSENIDPNEDINNNKFQLSA